MSTQLGRTFQIRSQEKATVSYFLLLFFLLGCGMAVGRYSAEAMFFKRYGIEYLPLVYIVHGLLLVVLATVYSAYAERLTPEKILTPLGLVLVSILGGLWWLMSFSEWTHVYPIYLLLYELAAEIVLLHCALYLSRNIDVMHSKRLLPIVFGGWQIGAIAGGLVLMLLAPQFGVQNMPLLWLGLLCAALLLVALHHIRSGSSPFYRSARKDHNPLQQALVQFKQGVSFTGSSPLFMRMCLALGVMLITLYCLNFAVNRLYTEHFTDEASLVMFLAGLGVVAGLIGLSLQLLITNRVMRRFGVRKLNMILPTFAVAGFIGLLASFTLAAAVAGSIIKDALLPALRNPVRGIFLSALPDFIQDRAHAVWLAVVAPLALVAAGSMLMLVQTLNQVLHILLFGLLAALAYFILNWQENIAYVQTIAGNLREKLFTPDEQFQAAVKGDEKQVLQLLTEAAAHQDDEVRFMAAKTLLDVFPRQAAPLVLSVMDGLQAPLRDQLIAHLLPSEPRGFKEYLLREINSEDEHLKATALLALFHLAVSEARDSVANALDSGNPRIKTAGIFGAMNYPVDNLLLKAKQHWHQLLSSGDKGQTLAALDLLVRWPQADFIDEILSCSRSDDTRTQLAAIAVLDKWPDQDIPGLPGVIVSLMGSEEQRVRVAAAQLLYRLTDAVRSDMATVLMEDDHPEVRLAAAHVLFPSAEPIDKIEMWLLDNRHSPKALRAVVDLFLSRRAKRHTWERIARYFCARAAMFFAAYLALDRNARVNDGLDLLRMVMRERAMQTLDLTLHCAMQYEDHEAISVILAGVTMNDKSQWAKTMDAVQHIDDKSLARSLSALLESMNSESPMEITRRWRFREISTVLEWVHEQGDPWLTRCAVRP